MLKQGWGPFLWSGFYAIILISLATPFGILLASFIMVPTVILLMLVNERRFAFYYIGVLVLLILLYGAMSVPVILISLFFLVPTIVMSVFYKKNSTAQTVLTAGIVSMLGQFVLLFLILSAFGINMMDTSREYILESLYSLPQPLLEQYNEEQLNDIIALMTRMLPMFMISLSFYYVVLTHILARKISSKLGMELAKMKPFKDWMLPKALVWYFLIGLLFDMFIQYDPNSILTVILINMLPLLTFAFVIQAISFLFYWASFKKWNYTLPIVGIIAGIFLPSIVCLLGVFDVAFNLRQRLQKS